MDLRAMVEADLGVIMEGECSFRNPITITDPDGNFNLNPLYADTGDVAELLDPDTGMAVLGRSVRAAVRMSSIIDEGLGIPKVISRKASKPWVVEFDDIALNGHVFKVKESNQDRTIGIVHLVLEVYKL